MPKTTAEALPRTHPAKEAPNTTGIEQRIPPRSMITVFDRVTCKLIHEELSATLKTIAEKHGVEFKLSGGTYTPDSFRVVGEFLVREVGGVSRDRAEFNRHCHLFQLKPEDWGKKIRVEGEGYTLVGVELNRPKFAYKLKRQRDGVIRLHTAAVVERIRHAPLPAAAE